MRTLIDIPDDIIDDLDGLARRHGRSRAAEVREALKEHIRAKAAADWIARGAGYWKERGELGDAIAYQRAIRQDRERAGATPPEREAGSR